jgi:hypothetical protein
MRVSVDDVDCDSPCVVLGFGHDASRHTFPWQGSFDEDDLPRGVAREPVAFGDHLVHEKFDDAL